MKNSSTGRHKVITLLNFIRIKIRRNKHIIDELTHNLSELSNRIEGIDNRLNLVLSQLFELQITNSFTNRPIMPVHAEQFTGKGMCASNHCNLKYIFPNMELIPYDEQAINMDYYFLWGTGTYRSNRCTAQQAHFYNKPLYIIEDGFIRSLTTWYAKSAPDFQRQGISFTIDYVPYYDARYPGTMELMLNDPELIITDDQRQRARSCINKIVRTHLTKYNHQPIFTPKIGRDGVKKVLVVDQSYGDMSISKGWGSEETFKLMLECAIEENPDADIIVKTHPDAIAGTRGGYYTGLKPHDNIYTQTEAINPISLIKYVDDVYVCTTQLGFEALMCGKRVHVFGMPFYANWGLTDDRQHCSRRTNKRSLEEVFYIAYIMYSHYVNPDKKCSCEIEEAMDYLLKLRDEQRNKLIRWWNKTQRRALDLDHPRTLGEKIQWLKLYDSTPIKTRLADKVLVREWVKERIGEEYLVPIYGVYDRFEEIDFDQLPNQFVIKCNHGSGWNIIVTNKEQLDIAEAKEKVDSWMATNYAFLVGYELHYRDIVPKIIIEEYIAPAVSRYEIQAWVFNGQIRFVSVESNKDSEQLERGTYYVDGTPTEFVISPAHYRPMSGIPCREVFNQAIELSNQLLVDTPLVRIDFLEYGGSVRFRELTFTPGSGLSVIEPEEYDINLGEMITLPSVAYDIDTGKHSQLPGF